MRMTLKRMRQQALAMVLLLSLAACGKWEEKPVSAADLLEKKMRMAIHEEERERLEKLREESSVRSATIVTGLNKIGAGTEYEYLVDLGRATATIRIEGQEEETYLLDSGQIDSLNRLLLDYTVTVHEGSPYWPTGDYCTMTELFDYQVSYDGDYDDYYSESGALTWPEGWDEFIEELNEQIVSGEWLEEEE